jgi:zona occludens toxin (predicted ATPase)
MIEMKSYFSGFAVAALLVLGPTLSSHAEDAAAPKAESAPAAAQTEAPPPSVARPSIAPKAAEPAAPPVAGKNVEPDAKNVSDQRPRQRRYAHRHHRRYGSYRTAYWQPFPIYWPHLYRNRIHWSRTPWAFHF